MARPAHGQSGPLDSPARQTRPPEAWEASPPHPSSPPFAEKALPKNHPGPEDWRGKLGTEACAESPKFQQGLGLGKSRHWWPKALTPQALRGAWGRRLFEARDQSKRALPPESRDLTSGFQSTLGSPKARGTQFSEGLGLGFIPFGVSYCSTPHPHFRPLPRLVDPGCRQPPGALAQGGGGRRSAALPSVII